MINLELHGTVGEDFTSAGVQRELRAGGPVNVTLNSGGGYADHGSAIYAILDAHPALVTVNIVGMAASAASLIAMAGDTITMADGAVMMIHDPAGITYGTSDEHSKSIERLEVLANAYAKVYAKRSGKTEAECREIMRAETWYGGQEAVAAGFATGTSGTKAQAFALFDYAQYRGAATAFAKAQLATQKPAAAKDSWSTVISKLNGTKTGEQLDPAANYGWNGVMAKVRSSRG